MKNKKETEFDTTHSSQSAIAEDLHRRANYPYRGSAQYQRAVADCVAALKAQRPRAPFTLASVEWNPRIAAALFVVLIALVIVFWAGCKTFEAAASTADKYNGRLAPELTR